MVNIIEQSNGVKKVTIQTPYEGVSASINALTQTVAGKADKTDVNGKANQSDLDATNAQLADIATVNDHTITYGYDTNSNIQTVTEKDSSNNVIKTVTYTYDPTTGNVSNSVTVINGKTVSTTYNYDTNGNITSTSNVIS